MYSVVIPAYNAGSTIARAIDSVLAQTWSENEIIVVDDGSTDDTENLVRQYDRVKYCKQENQGQSVARNRGILEATFDWIAFLDADDEWYPDKIEMQWKILEKNPFLMWCATNYDIYDGDRSSPRIRTDAAIGAADHRGVISNYFEKAGKGCCQISTITLVVRKSVFDKVGFFDADLRSAEDTDMWWRIAHLYPEIGFIPRSLARVNLDNADAVLSRRRLESKRGKVERLIVEKHLELAAQSGHLAGFERLAQLRIQKAVVMMLFHGHGQDANETIEQFSGLFRPEQRIVLSLLSRFPQATSRAMRIAAKLARMVGLEREVSRRWRHPHSNETDGKNR